ncbi:MAG: tetratricopeptide repeat protein, partial [Polyangiaceae bacterium]
VLDLLQSLRNKSLLRATEESDAPRYDLFETVRDFARAEATPTEYQATRARHAAFFLAEGKAWAHGANGKRGEEHRAALARERENLIAAHATWLESSAAKASEMIAILEPLFSTRGPLDAFARLVDASLETAEKSGDSRSLGRLLRIHAQIDRQRGRARDAKRNLARALDLARASNDVALEAEALGLLGVVEWQLREVDDAEAHTRGARELHAKAGNRRLEGMCVGQLGVIAGFHRRFDEARTLLEEARATQRGEGDVHNEAITSYFLASTIFDQGDTDRAKRGYEDALSLLRESDNRRYEGVALYMLALVELERDHLTESHALLEDALRILRAIGDLRLEGVVQTGFGHHALARRDPREAITRYEEGAALLQQVGGDPRYEGLALACAGAAAACLDREEDAKMALSSARALLAGIGDAVAIDVVAVLEGFVMLASARSAQARSEEDRARALRSEAIEKAHAASGRAALERLAARLLRREIDASPVHGEAVVAQPPATERLEIGPRGEWFRRGGTERVDLTRRPKLRMLLEALLEKRLASPGDPAQAEWLMSRVWPQEKILPSAASSRLYVAVATLRKLGLHDVLVTRGDGYLLHPAVHLRS